MVEIPKGLVGQIRHEHRAVHVFAAAIAAQVDDQRFGSLVVKRLEGFLDPGWKSVADEIAQTNLRHFRLLQEKQRLVLG